MRNKRTSKFAKKIDTSTKKKADLIHRKLRLRTSRRRVTPLITNNNYALRSEKSKMAGKRTRNIFMLILLITLIFLVYFEVIRPVQSKDIRYSPSNITIVLRVSYIELGETERAPYLISSWEEQYLSRLDSYLGSLTLDHIYIPDGYSESYLENKSICVRDISIQKYNLGDETGKDVAQNTLVEVDTSQENICLNAGKNYIFTDAKGISTIPFEDPSLTFSTFYYPFDKRQIIFNLSANLFTKMGDQQDGKLQEGEQYEPYNILPEVEVVVSPKWRKSLEYNKINDNNSVNLSLSLERPGISKIITFFLPIVFIVIMYFMMRIQGEAVWEIIIGLLSLWGIHDVLKPDYINSPTIASNIIYVLYFLYGMVVIYELLIERNVLRESINSLRDFLNRLPFR